MKKPRHMVLNLGNERLTNLTKTMETIKEEVYTQGPKLKRGKVDKPNLNNGNLCEREEA